VHAEISLTNNFKKFPQIVKPQLNSNSNCVPLSMIHLSKTSPNSCSAFCPNLAGFIPDMFAVPVVFHKKNVGLQVAEK
jgi:hypothetical protein